MPCSSSSVSSSNPDIHGGSQKKEAEPLVTLLINTGSGLIGTAY